jgi:hypothetical protein
VNLFTITLTLTHPQDSIINYITIIIYNQKSLKDMDGKEFNDFVGYTTEAILVAEVKHVMVIFIHPVFFLIILSYETLQQGRNLDHGKLDSRHSTCNDKPAK